VSHIVQILDRADFDAQFALVLKGIRRHGWEWKDREAWRGGEKYDFSGPERVVIPGEVHPMESAPAISPRMLRALELFGQEGDFHTGLKRLYRDSPVYWTGDTERNTGDHSRLAGQIERELWAAWLRAQ